MLIYRIQKKRNVDIPAHRDVRRPWNTPLPWLRVFFCRPCFWTRFWTFLDIYCFGTYSAHAQTCDNVRVQTATQWIASVHTLHGPKPDNLPVQSATQWDCFGKNCSSRWMQPRPTCTLVAKKGKLRAKATKQIRWLGIQQANSAGPTFCWPQHEHATKAAAHNFKVWQIARSKPARGQGTAWTANLKEEQDQSSIPNNGASDCSNEHSLGISPQPWVAHWNEKPPKRWTR